MISRADEHAASLRDKLERWPRTDIPGSLDNARPEPRDHLIATLDVLYADDASCRLNLCPRHKAFAVTRRS